MSAMPWLDLIPWRFVLPLLGLMALSAAALFAVHSYGDQRYESGRSEVLAEVAEATIKANKIEREKELKRQEQIDEVAKNYQTQLDRVNAALAAHQDRLADATADGIRLRGSIAALTDLRASQGGKATSGVDETTRTLGQLLDSCSIVAERAQDVASASAASAERLAEQVRGLQSYANKVSSDEPNPGT